MCDPELDQILEYLSTKLNRIFCDREFVGIVKEDLQVLRNNVNKPCVLVFPILGHIFLKAVRYQAKILNLAVFYIGSGHKRAIAVCSRDYLIEKLPNIALHEASVKMNDENIKEPNILPTTKRKTPRPAQQLYVPPAQRHRHVNTDKKSTKRNGNSPKNIKENKTSDIKSTHEKSTKIQSFENFKPCDAVSKLKTERIRVQCNNDSENLKEHRECGESATATATKKSDSAHALLEAKLESVNIIDLDQEQNKECVSSEDNIKTANGKVEEDLPQSLEIAQEERSSSSTAERQEECVKDPVSTTQKDINCDAKSELIINAKKVNDEVDKEKEEMRRATERINRKSRSIIKYIDNNDTLKIEIDSQGAKKNNGLRNGENLTNWEDMFDDDGELKEPYLDEIVKHVGNEVTIIKTSEDYSPYQNNKALEDLDHVIELYDFPASFKTHDIIQLYSEVQSDTMYVKWVDDTHALLVLSTPVQAQRALHIENDLMKSRPMSEASSLSQSVAFKHDLKPAMKRPQTSLQTARRMISTHLGTKSALSKEVMEKERKLLRDAREQKRQERQNEKDAWDGNPRPSTA